MKFKILLLSIVFLFSSCANKELNQSLSQLPSWYISPKQNDNKTLYGVAEGHTIEEATKSALANLASRLIVTISAQSSMISEENQNSVNEEFRQKISQNIEKINFNNFRIDRSAIFNNKFFVEVNIDRNFFISDQKEQVDSLERKIENLSENISKKNIIQQRNNLIKILSISQELDIKSRILKGLGLNIDIASKEKNAEKFSKMLNNINEKTEFYFDSSIKKEIATILKNAINKEKMKIAKDRDQSNKNQVVIDAKIIESKNIKLYSSFLSKIKIDIEVKFGEKIIGSNSFEISGSSVLGEKESYLSAIKSLEDKIIDDGFFKVIGIITK